MLTTSRVSNVSLTLSRSRFGVPAVVFFVMSAAEKVAPRFDHGGLEADLAHVDIRHPGISALVTQLPAALSDPAGGLAKLFGRRAVMLRLGSPVASKIGD